MSEEGIPRVFESEGGNEEKRKGRRSGGSRSGNREEGRGKERYLFAFHSHQRITRSYSINDLRTFLNFVRKLYVIMMKIGQENV
jgi:hypothetical protein